MYAIIGIGLRLPGGTNNPVTLYENLKSKKDCIEEIPSNRWNKDFFHHPDKTHPGTMVHKRGGFLHPYFNFDNESFSMSIKEAKSLDPSTKVLLEVALETFQDANVKYRGTKTGVFIGTGQQGFTSYLSHNNEYSTEYSATGCEIGVQSNMLSYKFDLRGPSMSIDTACSSSATALYTAINSFKSGSIDMALVGGYNHLLNFGMSVCFSRLGVLSKEGKCKSFDEAANGYVRSEGCGIVLVKPLQKALEDGNVVYSIIREIDTNEDGSLEASLTKPSSRAQEILIRSTLTKAKIKPSEVFYVEAHATGTQVGDPAESSCIGKVCSNGRKEESVLRIGSVKTNIGHCEMASFIASLIKCCIMYERKELLPTIVNRVSPKLGMKKYNMKVQTICEKFDPHGKIFVINSFGFGGANACCVLEGFCPEECKIDQSKKIKPPYLFITAGRTESTLQARIKQYQEYSKTIKDQHQLSYSMNTCVNEGARILSYGIGESCHECSFVPSIRVADRKSPICFVFSGQGPQNLGMGRGLYKTFPLFKEIIDKCDKIYKKLSGISIINDVGLFGDKVCSEEKLKNIEITLPGLMFLQVGCWELWKSFGIIPDVIVGHSFGEMTSMYANGSVSLEDILKVTYARGKICKTLDNAGRMIAIGSSVKVVNEIIEKNGLKQVWVAAENSPVSCTVGGIHDSINKLDKICEDLKIFHRILSITNAFHTPLLEPMRETAEKLFPDLKNSLFPEVRFFSTVTANYWDAPFSREYLWKNMSHCVQFKSAIEETLRKYGESVVFLELAPHPVLSLSMKQCGAKKVIFSLKKGINEQTTILSSCARLIGRGFEFNWDKIMGKSKRMKYLPRYPFQRNNCFLNIESIDRKRFVNEKETLPGPLLGRKQDVSIETWRNSINTKKYKWLNDHIITKSCIYPAAGYIEQFLELSIPELEDIRIHSPLLLSNDKYSILETRNNDNLLTIYSRKEFSKEWTLHTTAKQVKRKKKKFPCLDFTEIIKRCKKKISKKEIYQKLELKDLSYGKYFQLLENLNQGDDEAFVTINTKNLRDVAYLDRYSVHPSILDSTAQLIELLIPEIKTYLPTFIKRISVYSSNFTQKKYYCHGFITDRIGNKVVVGNALVYDQESNLVMEVIGLELTHVSGEKDEPKLHYTSIWQTKKYPKIYFGDFLKNTTSQEIKKFEQYFGKLKNNILLDIKSSLKKLKNLNVPKLKHNFLNWVLKFSKEHEVKEKFDIPQDIKENFNIEYDLMANITKYFALIMRNKPNTEESKRVKLINDFYFLGKSFSIILRSTLRIFMEMSKHEDRVIRILEISDNFGSLAKLFMPLIYKKMKGRIEVYVCRNEDLKSELSDYSCIIYKDFNLKKNLLDQGILKNSIDLVLCSGVCISQTIVQNIKDVLVSSGKLVSIQPNEESHFFYNFIFASVSKNWKSSENVPISLSSINQILKENNLVSHSVLVGFYNLVVGVKEEVLKSNPSAEYDVFDKPDTIELLEYVQKHKKEKPLIVVTRGTRMDQYDLEYSPNIGFFRVLANEYPKWRLKMVDFPKGMDRDEEKKWISRISSNLDYFENEFCIRNNEVYVPRLVKIIEEKSKITKIPREHNQIRLHISKPGILNSLTYSYFEKPSLEEKELFIKVKSASLNFKDLMLAQNMLRMDKKLGLEFSGVVLEIGTKVTKFKVGDSVFGFADNSLSSHVKTTENLIVKKPENISFEEAASIPTIFITPYFALVKKCQIKENDYVLIHSAAGGVGQAAIQIALENKAIPVCTCGTNEKRVFLKQKYGVKIFGDSHSNEWDTEIIDQLPENKKGVDIVLNSLAKDNIERGIKLLRPFGSFIEIGKRDILDNSHIHLLPFLENLSYYSVHIDKMIEKRKDLICILLKEVTKLFQEGKLKSLVDKVFKSSKIIEAFRYMQSGKHKGKIIINFDDQEGIKIKKKIGVFSSKKTYVLSGGLGVIGFKIAEWMILKEGVRYIVLLSRSGKTTKRQNRILEKLNKTGVKVFISKTDVSKKEDVLRCYETIKKMNYPSLGGIIHLAMVLRDGKIDIQTKKNFLESFAPKILGARNLVDPLKPNEVDFVLMFSSISSVVGNIEQSNYCASNSFLNSYAYHLNQKGFNAKVINLGAVIDVGIIAEDVKLRMIMEHGLLDIQSGMKISQVFSSIRKIMMDKKNTQFIPELKLNKIINRFPGISLKWSHLAEKVEAKKRDSTLKSKISIMAIKNIVANLVQMNLTKISPDEKLTVYGIDSLLAVEISNILKSQFGVTITQMEILGGLTINDLVSTMMKKG